VKIDYVQFEQRADRSAYIARRFGDLLGPALLDVGCDKALLRTLLPQVAYTGIDVGGTPDIRIDLEHIERLPFADDQFDATVCSDVLEHLDNLHFIFGELVRVSREHIVVSLPNNWTNARRPIERGRGAIAHYGLPATPPPDRHKWFFGFSEAVDFLREQERRYPISIVELVANEKRRPLPARLLRRARYPALETYLNRYAHTVWVVYRKRAPRPGGVPASAQP